MQGRVFNIQRFSIHDGPGIRTSVFVKGCNLRCLWCHNPESISPRQEIQFFPQKSRDFEKLIAVCPAGALYINAQGEKVFDRSLCNLCGECVRADLYDSFIFVSKDMTVDEVVAAVAKDADYYANSGGGMTISGGEPLLQSDYVRAVFERTRALGIHNALDTAANVDWKIVESVLPVVDLVLLDLKVMDSDTHRRATGVPNERILQNARRIAQADVDMIVRIPVIPGINDSAENMIRTAEFVRDFPRLLRVELLPYHELGEDKYASLGRENHTIPFETPSPEKMAELAGYFRQQGVAVHYG